MEIRRMIAVLMLGAVLTACGSGENPMERAQDARQDPREQQEDIGMEGTRLEADARFLNLFCEQVLFSLEADELAARQASNAELKTLAGQMRQDHQRLYDEVMELSRQAEIPLPTAMNAELTRRLEDLREKEGENFDEKYLENVLRIHEDIGKAAEEVIASSQIEAIFDFAQKVKSQQYVHLNLAKQLENKRDS